MQGLQPRPLAADWEWQYQAACKGMATDIFFYSDRERGPRRARRERIAKAICATCPMKGELLGVDYCNQCKCILIFKTAFRYARCPLAKWHSEMPPHA